MKEEKSPKNIELLAPAGTKEAFIAAVEAGANAIYLGGKLFNARMNAGNFDNDEMREAVAFAHKRGVRVHVTLNILLKEEELPDALSYAAELYEMGVDALIVQDLGLAYLLKKYLPDFELHFSTQGTIYDLEGVKAAARLGFDRVVLARELSLEEIREICSESPVDIETFCHGAICMCYSGQCQMSRAIGGRSGNRGGCAQPCRLAYEGFDEKGKRKGKGYYLSPADMSMIDRLGDLIDAGVMSFKIEGRMKSPEYVGIVTSIYRKYIDAYLEKGSYEVRSEDRLALAQIFNRGFTTHHLEGSEDSGFMSGDLPKNKGVEIGKVVNPAAGRNLVDIELAGKEFFGREPGALPREEKIVPGTEKIVPGAEKIAPGAEIGTALQMGDGIEIREAVSGTGSGTGSGSEERRVNALVTFMETKGRLLRIGDIKEKVKAGDKVYRISSKAQLDEAAVYYKNKDWHKGKYIRKTPLSIFAEIEKGILRIQGKTLGKSYEIEIPVEEENSFDLKERFESAFRKTGDSPFAIERMEIKGDLNISLPMSKLNELRRELIGGLEELIAAGRKTEGMEPAEVDWDAITTELTKKLEKEKPEKEKVESGEIVELFFYSMKSLWGFLESGEYSEWGKAVREKGKDLRIILPLAELTEEIDEVVKFCNKWEKEFGGKALEIIPYIDNVTRGSSREYMRGCLKTVSSYGFYKVYIGGVGWADDVINAGMKPLADIGINSYNPWTVKAAGTLGIEEGMPSLEVDGVFYGKKPLMIMEHSPKLSTLVDRKGARYALIKRDYSEQTILAQDERKDSKGILEDSKGKRIVRVFMPDSIA